MSDPIIYALPYFSEFFGALERASGSAIFNMFSGNDVQQEMGEWFRLRLTEWFNKKDITIVGLQRGDHEIYHAENERGVTITIDPWFVVNCGGPHVKWQHRFFAILAFHKVDTGELKLVIIHDYVGKTWYVELVGREYRALKLRHPGTEHVLATGSFEEVLASIQPQLEVDADLAARLLSRLTDLRPTS